MHDYQIKLGHSTQGIYVDGRLNLRSSTQAIYSTIYHRLYNERLLFAVSFLFIIGQNHGIV
jgi:hypothetical protein